jgi:hypothetical protein
MIERNADKPESLNQTIKTIEKAIESMSKDAENILTASPGNKHIGFKSAMEDAGIWVYGPREKGGPPRVSRSRRDIDVDYALEQIGNIFNDRLIELEESLNDFDDSKDLWKHFLKWLNTQRFEFFSNEHDRFEYALGTIGRLLSAEDERGRRVHKYSGNDILNALFGKKEDGSPSMPSLKRFLLANDAPHIKSAKRAKKKHEAAERADVTSPGMAGSLSLKASYELQKVEKKLAFALQQIGSLENHINHLKNAVKRNSTRKNEIAATIGIDPEFVLWPETGEALSSEDKKNGVDKLAMFSGLPDVTSKAVKFKKLLWDYFNAARGSFRQEGSAKEVQELIKLETGIKEFDENVHKGIMQILKIYMALKSMIYGNKKQGSYVKDEKTGSPKETGLINRIQELEGPIDTGRRKPVSGPSWRSEITSKEWPDYSTPFLGGLKPEIENLKKQREGLKQTIAMNVPEKRKGRIESGHRQLEMMIEPDSDVVCVHRPRRNTGLSKTRSPWRGKARHRRSYDRSYIDINSF